MIDESDGPRVFEEGTITQVLGADGFNLYVGALHIKYLENVETLSRQGKPTVRIRFQKRDDRNAQKIEENMRIAKTLPWIEVS